MYKNVCLIVVSRKHKNVVECNRRQRLSKSGKVRRRIVAVGEEM